MYIISMTATNVQNFIAYIPLHVFLYTNDSVFFDFIFALFFLKLNFIKCPHKSCAFCLRNFDFLSVNLEIMSDILHSNSEIKKLFFK